MIDLTSPPDFSNDKCDFWVDETTTEYLRTDLDGKPVKALEKWVVFKVRLKENSRVSYVIFDGRTYVNEAENLHAISVMCDMYRAANV